LRSPNTGALDASDRHAASWNNEQNNPTTNTQTHAFTSHTNMKRTTKTHEHIHTTAAYFNILMIQFLK